MVNVTIYILYMDPMGYIYIYICFWEYHRDISGGYNMLQL